MKSRLTRSYVILAAAAAAASLPCAARAQSLQADAASDSVVVKARETAKAVAAAASAHSPSPSPATASIPAAPPSPTALPSAASNSGPGVPEASGSAHPGIATGLPAPTGSPTTAASGSPSAPKAPVTIAAPAGTTIPAGSPVIIVQAAQAPTGAVESTANNWLGGLLGLGILGAAGYFGLRAAKNRGLTVEGALKQMGVETQPAMPSGPNFAAIKPAPAPMPPLPSLSELPLAGPASSAGLAMGGAAVAQKTVALVGVAGPVKGERFDLDQAALPFSVGRDDVNSLALTGDAAISRRHAQIIRSGVEWTVSDLGSSNGTFVNGARLKGQQPLRAGDEIQIGGSRFRFEG